MLNSHSYHSYKYGILPEKALLEFVQKSGYDTWALTDINNTSACLNFTRLAPDYGIRPVLGIDFRNGAQQQFVGLAHNNDGFHELNNLLSFYLHSGESFPERAPELEHADIIYPFHKIHSRLHPNEYIGVRPADIPHLRLCHRELGQKGLTSRLVAMPTMTFQTKLHFNMHRLLCAINNNKLLSKLTPAETGNSKDLYLPLEELLRLYADFPELLQRAFGILEHCRIDFEFGPDHPHKNLRTYTGSEESDREKVHQLCRDNLHYRYPNPDKAVYDRLEKELDIIERKGFLAYFLINWDIVNYARHKGYFYVGRGSGANSIVAYLLRITDVDPIELDLYFERFINLYRKNPPDFDIDFSWRDRPDVTRYIFDRFPHTALLGAYSSFQYRAIVRELGKVFGLPGAEINRLAEDRFSPIKNPDKLTMCVKRYAELLEGFPSFVTLHSAGILISEESIHKYSATFMPPKGYPTTQFDMVIAEDIGLYKFDILGQRGLGKIKDAMELIKRNHPEVGEVDIHDLPRFKKDEKIKELLRNGDAIGCFYVESPAMRVLMKKLRVDNYPGLVAASSIIRPGVARSGMMREYIMRYRLPEKRKEAHPVLRNIMPDTYGVMVYQEDVIKVAHYFAGLDLGEADVLRRGMSGKFRSREEFAQARDKFFSNCLKRGYGYELTAEVWRQIESFAGYAFAKGHSASYAVESYQSLFLKAYYPLEYMVATLNNFGGFYRPEFYVHEARMKGGEIHLPCVNLSETEATLYSKDIYLGLMHIIGLESEICDAIVKARRDNPFQDLDDFIDRVSIGIEQLTLLLRIDAFRFTGKSRQELMWEAHLKLGPHPKKTKQATLFSLVAKKYSIPALDSSPLQAVFDQLELLGYPLCDPFELLQEDPGYSLLSADLPINLGQRVTLLGYLVTMKRTTTIKGEHMYFGNFLDRGGHFIDTVHFPPVAKKYPFCGRGVYVITGKVTEEFDCFSIEVEQMEKMPIIPDPRYAEDEEVYIPSRSSFFERNDLVRNRVGEGWRERKGNTQIR